MPQCLHSRTHIQTELWLRNYLSIVGQTSNSLLQDCWTLSRIWLAVSRLTQASSHMIHFVVRYWFLWWYADLSVRVLVFIGRIAEGLCSSPDAVLTFKCIPDVVHSKPVSWMLVSSLLSPYHSSEREVGNNTQPDNRSLATFHYSAHSRSELAEAAFPWS